MPDSRNRHFRPSHLSGKPPEPRRQEQQFIDLMCRNRGAGLLLTREDIAHQSLQFLALPRRPRLVQLGAYHSALHEIDTVLAFISLDRINEGEILDSEPEPAELLSQEVESRQLVAVRSRPLELQPLARLVHLRAQHLHGPVIRSVEKGARERDARVVLVRRAAANAWSETLSYLVANASRSSR